MKYFPAISSHGRALLTLAAFIAPASIAVRGTAFGQVTSQGRNEGPIPFRGQAAARPASTYPVSTHSAPVRAVTEFITSGQAALNLDLEGRSQPEPASEIVREIDDPSTGTRWLLYRNIANPGGPGRLILVGVVRPASLHRGATFAAAGPVVHTGDRVVVEESTPILDARLAATALNPASSGGPVRVRLELGGQIVAATAIAPGRVALEQEVRR